MVRYLVTYQRITNLSPGGFFDPPMHWDISKLIALITELLTGHARSIHVTALYKDYGHIHNCTHTYVRTHQHHRKKEF